MQRNTQQKEAVRDYLMSVCTHPTADNIYTAVKKKIPNISRGTVYRILNSFAEEGVIQEIVSDVSHYDGEVKAHAHFICKKCSTVLDLMDNKSKIVYSKNSSIAKVDSWQLNFYGYCKKCLK